MLVYVYPLIDAGLIAARAQPLLAQLKAGLRDRPGQVEFAVNPASGCFRFFDAARLWKNGNGAGLPKTAADAAKTAADYFKAANREALRYRTAMNLSASEYPDPFPVDALKHVSSKPVYANGASAPDHWLGLWMAWLPVKGPPAVPPDDAGITAPVHGAGVEVRIGAGGQVLGVVSTLRPWTGRAAVDAFEPPPSADGTPPALLYFMEGSGEPQRFIAPYFRDDNSPEADDHGIALRPACVYSLIARIGITMSRESTMLSALLMDGSGDFAPVADNGDYAVSWFCQRLDTIKSTLAADDSGATLSTRADPVESDGPTLTLADPGIYQAEVAVEHLPTGAARTTLRHVIVAADARLADAAQVFA
jgi:hypothetical protein